MTFHAARIGANVCFRLAGALGAGENFRNLDAAVGRACLMAAGAILIDMAQVTVLDCTGIGQLLLLRGRVSASGRCFGLVNVQARHQKMIEMARLSTPLGVHDAAGAKSIRSYRALINPGELGASRRIGLALV